MATSTSPSSSPSSAPAPITAQVLPASRWARLARRDSTMVYAMAALVAIGTAAGVCAGAILWQPVSAPDQGSSPVVQVMVLPPAPGCDPSAISHPCAPAEPDPKPAEPAKPAEPPAPAIAPLHGDHALTFGLDGERYVAISILDKPELEWNEPMPAGAFPRHGQLRLVGEQGMPHGVVATLADQNLAADVAAWRGHEVVVDNRCQATVTDLALVGLIWGSPDEFMERSQPVDDGADASDPSDADVAEAILRSGTTLIAGKLTGCQATEGIARSAALPLAMPAMEIEDDEAADAARAQLLGSRWAKKAQRSYAETEQPGIWWQAKDAAITSKVLRHPRTGEVLVSVHATIDEGCGGASINLWGLYRVERTAGPDGAGHAHGDGAVQVTAVDGHIVDGAAISTIEQAIDLDGDGAFEFFGRTSNGDPVLVSTAGKVIRVLEIPFYGCPC